MILLWFVVWVFSGTPHVGIPHVFGDLWNVWGTSLFICTLMQVLGTLRENNK